MRDAVIVGAVRTPIGKRGGALAGLHPVHLSAHVLNALADRTGLDPAVVDDVIWGCVSQRGEQGANLGRNAVLAAGWPEEVPGTTVDRQCGSSQQAVHFAAAGVIAGQYDVVVVGGAESMSRIDMNGGAAEGNPCAGWARERYGVEDFSQGLGAEIIAQRWQISRREADEMSLISHQRASAAIAAGAFEAQITPVPTEAGAVKSDEGVRSNACMEKMSSLRPAFAEEGLCSGARIMTTLVHDMAENGIQYGLQSMCEGGGMANATILELV